MDEGICWDYFSSFLRRTDFGGILPTWSLLDYLLELLGDLLWLDDGRNVWFKEAIQMSEKWKLTEEQNTGRISSITEFFIDELNELQEALDCSDEFIYDFMDVIRNGWSPDSC